MEVKPWLLILSLAVSAHCESNFSGKVNLAGKSAFRAVADLAWESDIGVTGSPASLWSSVAGGQSVSQDAAGSRPSVTASAFSNKQGLTFDGTADLLTNNTHVITRTGAASLSVLFKTGSTVTNGMVLVAQSNSSTNNDWWEVGIATDGKLYVENNNAGTKHTVKGSSVLAVSSVYYLVLTYDGTDFFLSLNNIEENPLVIENIGAFAWMGRVSTTPAFSIGATVISTGATRFFNGVIGGVYFWNYDLTQ